jgi:Uma2 family endonuclease
MSSAAAINAENYASTAKMSLESYFDFELEAAERHEFVDGQVRAMAYSTPAHGRIQTNISDELGKCLKAKGCLRYTSDRMILIPECENQVFYPDLVVVCGEEKFYVHKKKMKATLNPSVIIEILSDSTEEHDKTSKWSCYRKIKSLQQYIMVEQKAQVIHSYRRKNEDDRNWDYSCAEKADEIIDVLDCVLRVREVYEGI